jgi:hypothetical protein
MSLERAQMAKVIILLSHEVSLGLRCLGSLLIFPHIVYFVYRQTVL